MEKVNNVELFITDAFDNELMYQTLKDIVEGTVVEVPTYDFVTHSRCGKHSIWKHTISVGNALLEFRQTRSKRHSRAQIVDS